MAGLQQSQRAKLIRSALTWIASLGAVLLLTFVDFRILHVNSATAGFSFLLLVLALATRVGLRESITASFASMLAYNFFFLPPVGTFTIADPQNWVALITFLATAITAGTLSTNAKRRAEEASEREQEMRRMYNFSRSLMLGDNERSLANHIIQQLSVSFSLENVSLYDLETDTVFQIAHEGGGVPESLLRRVAASGETWGERESATVVPVRLGRGSLGSVGIARGGAISEVALEAVAQLIAIAIERARAQQIAGQLEATRQNEQLKSTLLDALAHEFKTPVTAVKAAITTLLSRPKNDAVEVELLTVIDEEADRMTKLVNDSIEMARIGSGPVEPHRALCSAEALISSTVRELRPGLSERELQVTVEPDLPPINVDAKLSGLALRQVLDNAFKYSPPGTAVRVEASRLDDRFIVMRVANEGSAIPLTEQTLLFEEFYRGREARSRVPGTGLGLNITREIIQRQGGRIWMESGPGQGVKVLFTLPVEQKLEAIPAEQTTN